MKLIKTITYQRKISYKILFIILSCELFLFSLFHYTSTANNDVYHQLLSTEKIIDSFDFSEIDPHPVGIPLISSLLIYIGIDPIKSLKWISPIIMMMIFYLLLFCLKNIEKIDALLISFFSCTHLFFLKSFNQFNAEILCLFFMLIPIFFTLKFLESKNTIDNKKYLKYLFFSSLFTILFRDAFIFIIFGCYFYILLNAYFDKSPKIYLIKIIYPFILFFIPVIYRLLNNPQSSSLEMIFTAEILIDRIKLITLTLFSAYKIIPEIVFPKLYYFDSNQAFLVVASVILASFYTFLILNIKKRIDLDKNKYKLIILFFFISLVYLFGISFSSGILNYKWGNLYRVSGLVIFYFGISFWTLIFEYFKNNKTLLKTSLLLIFFISQLKFIYAIRYEYHSSKERFLFDDHSKLNTQLIDSINNIQNVKTLNVFNGGGWRGRNLFSLLSYNAMIKKTDPYELKSQKNIIINKNLLISSDDFELYFNKNRFLYDIYDLLNGNIKYIIPYKK